MQCKVSPIQRATKQQQNAIKVVPNQENTPRGTQKRQQNAVQMEEKSGKQNDTQKRTKQTNKHVDASSGSARAAAISAVENKKNEKKN